MVSSQQPLEVVAGKGEAPVSPDEQMFPIETFVSMRRAENLLAQVR